MGYIEGGKTGVAMEQERRAVQVTKTALNMRIPEEHLELDQVRTYVEVVRDSDALRRELSDYSRGLIPGTPVSRQYRGAVSLLDAKHHILLDGIKFRGQDVLQGYLADKFGAVAELYGCNVTVDDTAEPQSVATASGHWRRDSRYATTGQQDFGHRQHLWWNGVKDEEIRAQADFQTRMSERAQNLGISQQSIDVFVDTRLQVTHIVSAEQLAAQTQEARKLTDVPGLTPPASVRLAWGHNLDQLVVAVLSDGTRADDARLSTSDFAIDLGQVARAHGLLVKPKA